MPYLNTEPRLPFAPKSHSSYTGAVAAAETRGKQTIRYLCVLEDAGPLTDHEAAARLHLPLSSICSIRNGVKEQLVPCGFQEVHVGARKTKRQRWGLASV